MDLTLGRFACTLGADGIPLHGAVPRAVDDALAPIAVVELLPLPWITHRGHVLRRSGTCRCERATRSRRSPRPPSARLGTRSAPPLHTTSRTRTGFQRSSRPPSFAL